VSLTISAVLISGILQLLQSSRQSDYLNDQLATMQENARLALSILSNEIRLAGYMGCADPNVGDLYVNQTKDTNGNLVQQAGDANKLMIGLNAGGGAVGVTPLIFNETELAQVVINGIEENRSDQWFDKTPRRNNPPKSNQDSDILIIQRASDEGTPVQNISGNQFTLTSANQDIDTNRVAIITDCRRLDMFYVSSFNPKNNTYRLAIGDNSETGLNPEFDTSAPIPNPIPELIAKAHSFNGDIYYVADNKDGIPTLYRSNLYDTNATVDDEIIQGIESLQVLYGVELSPDDSVNNISYITAETLNTLNNPRVFAVRLALLTRSYQAVLPEAVAREYDVFGATRQAPKDRFLRSVFTSTIKLRNHEAQI